MIGHRLCPGQPHGPKIVITGTPEPRDSAHPPVIQRQPRAPDIGSSEFRLLVARMVALQSQLKLAPQPEEWTSRINMKALWDRMADSKRFVRRTVMRGARDGPARPDKDLLERGYSGRNFPCPCTAFKKLVLSGIEQT